MDALAAAQAGAGIACVLDVHAAPRIADGSVVQAYVGWHMQSKTFYVVMPKSRVGSAKVRAFSDFLFEIVSTKRRPRGVRMVGVRPLGKR